MHLDSIPAIKSILQRGINSGLWTLEDLDMPSQGFVKNTNPDRAYFPGGYEGTRFHNLLRPDTGITHPETVTPKQPEADNPTSRTRDTQPSCPF